MSTKLSAKDTTTTIPANGQPIIYDPDEAAPEDQIKRFTGKLLTDEAFTVATLPTAATNTGRTIYVSDGAAGDPVLAFCDGTSWLKPNGLPVHTTAYTVATIPSAGNYTAKWEFVSDGAAGSPMLAFSDGMNWLRCDTQAGISDS